MATFAKPQHLGAFEPGLYGCRVENNFDENGRKTREEVGRYAQEQVYRILLDRGGHKKTVTRRKITPPYPNPIEENAVNDAWCDGLKEATKVLDLRSDAAECQAGPFPVKLPGVPRWTPAVAAADAGGPGAPFPVALDAGTGVDAVTAWLSLQWLPAADRVRALAAIRATIKAGGAIAGGLHAENSCKPVRHALALCAKRQKFKGCFAESLAAGVPNLFPGDRGSLGASSTRRPPTRWSGRRRRSGPPR